jgi:hypothetical protein
MGYTHYWSFKKPRGITTAHLEHEYQRALLQCARLIKKLKRDGMELSGYTAHTKLGQYGGLKVNGKGDDGHEEFSLREHFAQNDRDFCKTNQKPYDLAVTGCLVILKDILGDAITVSSDGRPSDWIQAVTLARQVLRRRVSNPIYDRAPKDIDSHFSPFERDI